MKNLTNSEDDIEQNELKTVFVFKYDAFSVFFLTHFWLTILK